jgi:hypothetical protein
MKLLSLRFDRHVDFLVYAHIVLMLAGRPWLVELGGNGQFRQFDVGLQCDIMLAEVVQRPLKVLGRLVFLEGQSILAGSVLKCL